MKRIRIPDEKGGHYTIIESGDFEYVDPIAYYKETTIINESSTLFEMLRSKFSTNEELKHLKAFELKESFKSWDKYKKEIDDTPIAQNFKNLLTSKSKKEQTSLMKGQSLTSLSMISFIFYAHDQFGFTLS